MNKLMLAKVVRGLAIALGVLIVLGIVALIIQGLIWWAAVHWASFAAIIGIGLLILVVWGGWSAFMWALDVLDEAKREEEAEQERARIQKKLAEYKEKYGENAAPPRGARGVLRFDEPPMDQQKGMYVGR